MHRYRHASYALGCAVHHVRGGQVCGPALHAVCSGTEKKLLVDRQRGLVGAELCSRWAVRGAEMSFNAEKTVVKPGTGILAMPWDALSIM